MKELDTYIHSLNNPSTIRVYRKDIQKFIDFFKVEKIEDVLKLTVDDYYRFYDAQGLSDVSLNGLIRSLSAFFTWPNNYDKLGEHAFFRVRFGRNKFKPVKKQRKLILT